MFSEDDIKEILGLFSPAHSGSGPLPSLVPSASGHELVTLPQLQDEFLRRVTTDKRRISLTTLALDLDVGQDIILQLARAEPTVVLFSGDSQMIVTESERHLIREELHNLMSLGFVPKLQYLNDKDIDAESLNSILADLKNELIDDGDCVCSTRYKQKLSEDLKEKLNDSLKEMRPFDIIPSHLFPKDAAISLPIQFKTPSSSFVYDILADILQSPDLTDKFYVLEKAETICCTPKRLLEQQGDAVVSELKSGLRPFVEIPQFRDEFVYVTSSHVSQYFENSPDIDIIDSYAISKIWTSKLGEECRKILACDGFVDVQQRLHVFPHNTEKQVLQKVEQSIVNILRKTDETLYQVAEYWLTEDGYASRRDILLSCAATNAQLQWQELGDSPEKEIKFVLSNITAMVNDGEPVLRALAQEKPMGKIVEEHFWNIVSEQRNQNETSFAIFWTERVISRTQIYKDGLGGVKDEKLLAQLAELFASYVQKELLPDVISKVQLQGLVLSQKTRKNVQKLDSRLSAEKMDTPTVMTALDKFNKKQCIETPDALSLEESKKAMVLDMIRRMQKQKKSDGPVLFLTLVVLLFAKHYPGVVYATGKFAPKLLKQLKSVLEPAQYERLEIWKEAAKTGTLSAEDREDMKKMAED